MQIVFFYVFIFTLSSFSIKVYSNHVSPQHSYNKLHMKFDQSLCQYYTIKIDN